MPENLNWSSQAICFVFCIFIGFEDRQQETSLSSTCGQPCANNGRSRARNKPGCLAQGLLTSLSSPVWFPSFAWEVSHVADALDYDAKWRCVGRHGNGSLG